jgi:hypothetical protein
VTSHRPIALALALLAVGCERRGSSSVAPSAATSSSTKNETMASASASASTSANEAAPHDPLVDELCRALHALPETRHAECCKQAPSLDLTDECIRGLQLSLATQTVSLDANEIHACTTALANVYRGCAHVGPNRPSMPRACLGVVHGSLPAKSRCRSSLECVDGLRCHGMGPTTAGTCEAPRAAGEACGPSIDVLATYTGQKGDESRHPECAGACEQQKCVAQAKKLDAAKIDQPCPRGLCEEGARCIAGTCIAPKPEGAPCDVDRECIGGCLKGAGEKSGKCGMRCDLPG